MEERDDRLAERHRLDREDAVPAGVQLVDDHVRVPVALERLAVVEPFDDLELDVELLARRDDVLGALARARRRRVQHDGTLAVCRRRRLDRAHVDPRRDHLRVRHPADRVVGADDARARALRPGELLAGLPRMSEPRKCMTERFPSARSSGNCTDFGSSVSPK